MTTIDGLPELARRLTAISDTRSLMRELQLATIAEAKHLVPRKTGMLGRSISAGDRGLSYAIVQATAGYAAFVEFGTKPHVIRPKRRKALAWAATAGGARLSGRARTGAAMRFATKVNHPGTKAKPFLIPGARAALKRAGVDGIVEKWNRAA